MSMVQARVNEVSYVSKMLFLKFKVLTQKFVEAKTIDVVYN